ncbi:glycerol-3-phosphate acyltransferase 3-like isoform X2 [Vespa velutina]|uniref:glycerol-3-phosphate acyltransferase 3-like isoform X2 n=1 Tax=Vespa velutina TaxID=202808 RepID=UPI001FB29FED|nr:glycerol-3-phosphate acyltransferase 3-like isoform X2 [Vespa velutina]
MYEGKVCETLTLDSARQCSTVSKMAFPWVVISFAFSLLLTPFLMFLLAIIFLASIGKSLGVRRLYVKLLLALFEYGRQNIEKERNKNNVLEEEEEHESIARNTQQKLNKHSMDKEFQIQNGIMSNNQVIARSTDLILLPEPEMQNNKNHIDEHTNEKIEEISKDIDSNKENTLIRRNSFETLKKGFEPAVCLDYIRAGVEAIIEDEVTSRFEAEELKNWNLLTRTNRHYEFISWKLTVIWMFGFFMRYCFLLPLRIFICCIGLTTRDSICSIYTATIQRDSSFLRCKACGLQVMWLTMCTAVVGYIPEGSFKRWLNYKVSIMCFAVLSSALSSVITYHHPENRPVRGICVANHTSPIDVLILMCDNCYSLIGQRHGGFLGILQRALARASPHIWFERSEVKDREAVARRLKEHVSDPTNPPILIFPEGTCINNTSVMQFKKGSFEVGGVIYPVAIKYDPRFGDAFWNSSRYSMLQYLYMMMSSWAIVCEVWYLPPMYRNEGESAIDFANRVKSVIARQGGLVDLQWDGQLKRMKPKKEWREKQQEEFSKRLKVE